MGGTSPIGCRRATLERLGSAQYVPGRFGRVARRRERQGPLALLPLAPGEVEVGLERTRLPVELAPLVEEARANDAEPLVRGDELGLPPGPDVGRLLAEIEEERAVGTIRTREEALDLARRRAREIREDG